MKDVKTQKKYSLGEWHVLGIGFVDVIFKSTNNYFWMLMIIEASSQHDDIFYNLVIG